MSEIDPDGSFFTEKYKIHSNGAAADSKRLNIKR